MLRWIPVPTLRYASVGRLRAALRVGSGPCSRRRRTPPEEGAPVGLHRTMRAHPPEVDPLALGGPCVWGIAYPDLRSLDLCARAVAFDGRRGVVGMPPTGGGLYLSRGWLTAKVAR